MCAIGMWTCLPEVPHPLILRLAGSVAVGDQPGDGFQGLG